jgi:hypothetical protein
MPLPAPYAPPWKRLGEDGVALLAWLGLKGRELWRRNREGSLPLPPFWPRRWPGLFWPFALAALLIGAGVLGRAWLGGSADQPAGPSPEEISAAGPPTPAEGRPAAPLGGSGGPAAVRTLAGPAADGRAAEPAEPPGAEVAAHPEGNPGARPEPVLGDQRAADLADGPAAAAAADPAREAPGPDSGSEPAPAALPSLADQEVLRLRAAWSDDKDDSLLMALRPDPASATLSLDLADAFLALKADERERLAERWRQRAMEAGYSHLRLRERHGRLVGREARVGGGMVVLEPPGEGGQEP